MCCNRYSVFPTPSTLPYATIIFPLGINWCSNWYSAQFCDAQALLKQTIQNIAMKLVHVANDVYGEFDR